MKITGNVHKYGSNVDTDVIIPARYLNVPDHAALASHCMEDIAIKASGIAVVIASSFARIFYRNCINIGLPIMECPEAAAGIEAGDKVSVDFDSGEIVNETKGEAYHAAAFPAFIQDIINAGGLLNSLKARGLAE